MQLDTWNVTQMLALRATFSFCRVVKSEEPGGRSKVETSFRAQPWAFLALGWTKNAVGVVSETRKPEERSASILSGEAMKAGSGLELSVMKKAGSRWNIEPGIEDEFESCTEPKAGYICGFLLALAPQNDVHACLHPALFDSRTRITPETPGGQQYLTLHSTHLALSAIGQS